MTYKTIISLFPSNAWLAERLGVQEVTVRQWGNRNSIPAAYWGRVVEFAGGLGIPLTLEDLAKTAAEKVT